jgi:AcrR family transcriptional regulator
LTGNQSRAVNFRTRTAQLRRKKMLARLLCATMRVCADSNRRGNIVIDDVITEAGVSRGAFYRYFDTLDEAIETLGRRLADDTGAETYSVFSSQPNPDIRAALMANPVLRAAVGGQVMMCRATMDRVWARYLSNIHFLRDESKFIVRVRRNLVAGRSEGHINFESIKVAVDYQVGAVLAAIRRCANDVLSASALMEMNILILRGLGLRNLAAERLATQAARIVDEVGPGNFPWWRKSR